MDTLDAIEAELAELQRHKARIAAREADLIQRADQLQAPYLDGARTMGEVRLVAQPIDPASTSGRLPSCSWLLALGFRSKRPT
jgi:hypothetical protein